MMRWIFVFPFSFFLFDIGVELLRIFKNGVVNGTVELATGRVMVPAYLRPSFVYGATFVIVQVHARPNGELVPPSVPDKRLRVGKMEFPPQVLPVIDGSRLGDGFLQVTATKPGTSIASVFFLFHKSPTPSENQL